MTLQVVGAGLPRTGTNSLRIGLEQLLGGRCYHMREIPGHPFRLGEEWERALSGQSVCWDQLLGGYVASVDWPASMFWRELSKENPEALVLLSVRDSAKTWWRSLDATILPYARQSSQPDWDAGCGLVDLLERFTGTPDWDDPAALMAAYERHNAEVRAGTPPHRLLQWRPEDGWATICQALDIPEPQMDFPWTNRREEWK